MELVRSHRGAHVLSALGEEPHKSHQHQGEEEHMSSASRRLIRLLVSAVTSLGLAAVAVPAYAATGGTGHTVTSTENFHGTQSFQDINPCTGDLLNINTTSNIVEHVTYFPAGDEVWATFTEEDKVNATDPATGVAYTGHATFWGNFNLNERNSNSTFTGSITLTGSDGSVVKYREVDHFTLAANGQVTVSFEKPRLTCG
jgi:hypothetical protein